MRVLIIGADDVEAVQLATLLMEQNIEPVIVKEPEDLIEIAAECKKREEQREKLRKAAVNLTLHVKQLPLEDLIAPIELPIVKEKTWTAPHTKQRRGKYKKRNRR